MNFILNIYGLGHYRFVAYLIVDQEILSNTFFTARFITFLTFCIFYLEFFDSFIQIFSLLKIYGSHPILFICQSNKIISISP